MGKVLSSKTAAQACVAMLALQKKNSRITLWQNNFLIVDEAEVA